MGRSSVFFKTIVDLIYHLGSMKKSPTNKLMSSKLMSGGLIFLLIFLVVPPAFAVCPTYLIQWETKPMPQANMGPPVKFKIESESLKGPWSGILNASGPYQGSVKIPIVMRAKPHVFEFSFPSLETVEGRKVEKEIPFSGTAVFGGRATMVSQFKFKFWMEFNQTLGQGVKLGTSSYADSSARVNVQGVKTTWGLPMALAAKTSDQNVEVLLSRPSAGEIEAAKQAYRERLKQKGGTRRAKMEKLVKEAKAKGGECGRFSACSTNESILKSWDKNNERKVNDCGRLLENLVEKIQRLKDCLPVDRFELVTQKLCQGLGGYCEEIHDVAESTMGSANEPYVGDSLAPAYQKMTGDVKCWNNFYTYEQFQYVWDSRKDP